jgi:hypothetical protein
MPTRFATPFLLGFLLTATSASADVEVATPPSAAPSHDGAVGTYARAPALEVNLFLPFFGIVDDKILIPVFHRDRAAWRGEAMLGVYTDFAWGPLSRKTDGYGKVWLLAAKPGYRQYLAYGFFVDGSVYLGWRHEEHNIYDGGTLNGFVGRLWLDAGWQVDFGPRSFVNVRGGAGLNLFRTDRYGSTERVLLPLGDLNVGLRF